MDPIFLGIFDKSIAANLKKKDFHAVEAIRKYQIKFKGIVDYAGLLRLINDWLAAKLFEVHNKKDKHKMGSAGAETEYKVIGWRNLTEFFRWRIEVEVWGWEEQDVEVIKDGEKKIMQKMRLWLRVNGTVESDYSNLFESSAFALALRKFLITKVLVHRISSYEWDMLHYKAIDLVTEIKKFLGMSAAGNEFADMW